jgi:hypothetical protein
MPGGGYPWGWCAVSEKSVMEAQMLHGGGGGGYDQSGYGGAGAYGAYGASQPGVGAYGGGGGAYMGGHGAMGGQVRRPWRPFWRPFCLRFTYVTSVLVKRY